MILSLARLYPQNQQGNDYMRLLPVCYSTWLSLLQIGRIDEYDHV